MPGLAGIVSYGRPIPNKEEKLDVLIKVGLVDGVSYQHSHMCTDSAVVLNTSTGLLESTRHQPARDPRRNISLFLEGEIFNVEELQDRLPSASNNGTTICEVLLNLYLEYGDNFVYCLNGEFNIAIYQMAEQRLSIFSDHMASWPMYYAHQSDCLFFGSEKKYVLSILESAPRLDPVGILQIFAHRYNLDDRTFLGPVKRFLPSTRLVFEGGRLAVSRYQTLSFNVPRQLRPTPGLIDEWSYRLQRSTNVRVKNKRRMVISLSGGLDSRAVACAIPRICRPISSRTRGREGMLEGLIAGRIAHRLGFDHVHEDPSTASLSQVLTKIVWRTECETHFANCLSIADHQRAKACGDFIIGGWLGDVSSGGHLAPDMLLPWQRHKFIQRAFRRHLAFSVSTLQMVFTQQFLDRTFPNLWDAFLESFSYLEGEGNVQVYEVWDLYQRQRRQTTSSMPVDSYLFEKIRPFYDRDYLNFTLTLPIHLRFGQLLYQSMIYKIGPEIRDVPSANNNLRIRRSLSGNLSNKVLTLVTRSSRRTLQRLNLRKGQTDTAQSSSGMGEAIRRDPMFRETIERYLRSDDFDDSTFSRSGINKLLVDQYDVGIDRSNLLGYVAMFAVGLPYFLNRTLRCPPGAEPLG